MPDSFTDPLVVEPLDDGVHWKLVQPFDYFEDDGEGKNTISVPVGFVTDFASIPRIFWDIYAPWGGYGKPAVLHDYLYSVQIFTRAKTDAIFLDAMKAVGVSWFTRWTIYLGVRAGGWVAWGQDKPIKK